MAGLLAFSAAARPAKACIYRMVEGQLVGPADLRCRGPAAAGLCRAAGVRFLASRSNERPYSGASATIRGFQAVALSFSPDHDLWRICANAQNFAFHPQMRGFTPLRRPLKVACSASSANRGGRDAVVCAFCEGPPQGRVEEGGSRVYVMRGRGLRAYISGDRKPHSGQCRRLPRTCSMAAADTLEWALVQAYQNNPSLNAQRASLRATDENVPQALSGYRPKLSVTAPAASITPARLSPCGQSGGVPQHRHLFRTRRRFGIARRRRDGDADAVQRFPDRQSHPPGGKPGDGRARDVARHRAASAARRLDRVHEFAARPGDPRTQSPQRRSAHRAAQADARPLQCRRGDAHRRRAGRIAAGRRTIRVARRAVELRDLGGQLSARHRRRSGPARARHAGRPAFTAGAARRDQAGPAAEPVGARRHVRRRYRRTRGEDQRRRALSEPLPYGERGEELQIRPTTSASRPRPRCSAR